MQEEGFEKPKSATGSGPSAKAGKIDRSDIANKVPSGFVNENEDGDEDDLDEAYAGAKEAPHRDPKTSKKCYDEKGNQVECGSAEAVKEGKDEDETTETTDDLQETFRRRNAKLFEKLVRWSKV